MTDELSSRQWRNLAKAVRNRDKANDTPCQLCGHPIAWNAKPSTPGAPSVDHITPRSLGGPLLPHPDQLRTVHHSCNSRRGNGTKPTPKPQRTSRNW